MQHILQLQVLCHNILAFIFFGRIFLKQTKQKEAIFNKVQQMRNHPSAEEIYTALKQDNENVSLATVYRNLNKFAEFGKIKKIETFNLNHRFDYRLDNHQHLLCEKCGGIFDIDINIDAKNKTFEISSYKILCYGICKNCKR